MRTPAEVRDRCDWFHRITCSEPDDPAKVTTYSEARDALDALLRENEALRAPFLESLAAAGFRKCYRLLGHPAWPDGLDIHPATDESAAKYHDLYVAPPFEEVVARLGHAPRRMGGEPYSAETWNPRIVIIWEHVSQREVFTPRTDCFENDANPRSTL